jgi:hypothetical protein
LGRLFSNEDDDELGDMSPPDAGEVRMIRNPYATGLSQIFGGIFNNAIEGDRGSGSGFAQSESSLLERQAVDAAYAAVQSAADDDNGEEEESRQAYEYEGGGEWKDDGDDDDDESDDDRFREEDEEREAYRALSGQGDY